MVDNLTSAPNDCSGKCNEDNCLKKACRTQVVNKANKNYISNEEATQ